MGALSLRKHKGLWRRHTRQERCSPYSRITQMPHKDREARKTYARLRARKLRAQCAMTRWAAREHRIAIRQPPPINELAWAAGCFEGEGTVTLTRAGRIMHVRPL